jgi:hypothetical protein
MKSLPCTSSTPCGDTRPLTMVRLPPIFSLTCVTSPLSDSATTRRCRSMNCSSRGPSRPRVTTLTSGVPSGPPARAGEAAVVTATAVIVVTAKARLRRPIRSPLRSSLRTSLRERNCAGRSGRAGYG